jgi:hypothetical protein
MRLTEISKRLASTAEQRAAKLVPPVALVRMQGIVPLVALEPPAEQVRKEIVPVERAQEPRQNQAELEQDRNPAEGLEPEPKLLAEPAQDRKPAVVAVPRRNRLVVEPALERNPAAAALTKSAVIKFHRAVAGAHSVEVAGLLPKQLVAGVAPVWVAEAKAVADAAAAAVEVAAVAGDASDEHVNHGTKNYELEIRYHEATKNFFARLCDRYLRRSRICIAGRTGS